MMTLTMRDKLHTLLIKHEGCRNYPYIDTVGKTTIGIGRNLSDRGILPDEITLMFNNDVDYFYEKLNKTFPWFAKLNEDRQIALIDMCFMGFQKFLTFSKMIECLAKGDMKGAATQIINSKYDKEVGKRADDIAEIVSTGVLHVWTF